MRIHKALSENGVASLRKAEELIARGKVTVNGHPATLGQDIDPAKDIVVVDGERVQFQRRPTLYYIALNKPRGWVTTMQDELGRRCVAELVKDVPARVYPVGRLDRDSEGLLLLTNDGDFANFIMHPSHHITKTYRVTVRPSVSEEQLIALSTGVTLDDGYTTAPAQVDVEAEEPGRVVLRITIGEGKNRQIRRMCDAVNLEVARLRRVSIGPVKLGMLQPGEWRELKPIEVGAIRNSVTTEQRPAKERRHAPPPAPLEGRERPPRRPSPNGASDAPRRAPRKSGFAQGRPPVDEPFDAPRRAAAGRAPQKSGFGSPAPAQKRPSGRPAAGSADRPARAPQKGKPFGPGGKGPGRGQR